MRVTHVITRLIVGGAQENTIASVLVLSQKPGIQAELLTGPTTGSDGSSEKYTDIFNGFNLEPFRNTTNDLKLRASLSLTAENIVVGKMARLFKLKGHEQLFAAAPALVQACPQLRFLLVGDGPWRGRF